MLVSESSYQPDEVLMEKLLLEQIRHYKPLNMDVVIYENQVDSLQRAGDFTYLYQLAARHISKLVLEASKQAKIKHMTDQTGHGPSGAAAAVVPPGAS